MDRVTRRAFLGASGAALAVGPLASPGAGAAKTSSKVKIIGISCSPRPGMTTATAVRAALEAAREVNAKIDTEMIDLGGKQISGWNGGARPTAAAPIEDDFNLILPSLRSPNLGGLIIGSPVYFRTMSSLCKAFLERLTVLRKPTMLLADKPVGVVAVGAYRNGGQELVIEHIQMAMLCHEVMGVGGKPRAHQGATLWNAYDDDITRDEFGMDTARKVGQRVAEAALKLI